MLDNLNTLQHFHNTKDYSTTPRSDSGTFYSRTLKQKAENKHSFSNSPSQSIYKYLKTPSRNIHTNRIQETVFFSWYNMNF
jgi:hypothetical protein